jgi:predicted transcriptional regulator of viral defense system
MDERKSISTNWPNIPAYSNPGTSQRLGYLIEMLGFKADKAIDILLQNLSTRYAPLDTLSESKGKYLQRWKIIVNVPENELLQWKEQA